MVSNVLLEHHVNSIQGRYEIIEKPIYQLKKMNNGFTSVIFSFDHCQKGSIGARHARAFDIIISHG